MSERMKHASHTPHEEDGASKWVVPDRGKCMCLCPDSSYTITVVDTALVTPVEKAAAPIRANSRGDMAGAIEG